MIQVNLTNQSKQMLIYSVCAVLLGSILLSISTYNLFYLFLSPALLLAWMILYRPVIIFWLLILSLPFSAEVQISSSLGTDFPDEPLMWVVAAITVFLLCSRQSLRKSIRHPLLFLLILHLSWIAVTIVFSRDPLISLKYFLAKSWYVLSFVYATVIFITTQKQIRLIAVFLIVGISVTTLVIFTRHAMIGFSFDDVSKVTLPFFRNHVNYSAMLVCTIPLVVAAYALDKSRRFLWGLLTIFLLSAVFFSFSRGAWAALFVGAIIAIAVQFKFLKFVFVLFSIAIVSTAIYFGRNNRYLDYRPDYYKTIYHGQLSQHLEATYKFQDLSTAERFYRWIAAVRMMEGNWITGYGPNNFYPNYKSHAVTVFRTYVSDNKEKSTVHNYFLLLLAEQGLPGVIIFSILFLAMFYYASKIYHSSTDRFTKVAALTVSAILGMIAVLIMLSDLIETDKIGSLFFLSLGLLFVLASLEKRVETNNSI